MTKYFLSMILLFSANVPYAKEASTLSKTTLNTYQICYFSFNNEKEFELMKNLSERLNK